MEEFSIEKTEKMILPGVPASSQSKFKKIKPAFGYFGSKNRLAKDLCSELPPHYCWVEAFCGSASLTLAKSPASIEVINDIDDSIINLFRQLRTNSDELKRVVSSTPYAKGELELARITNSNDSDLERARKFLVQSMFAINSAFGKNRGGFSYSQSYSRNGRDARVNRWYNLPDRLAEVIERLRDVRIENRDARDILKMFINRPATLVYLDPPYLGNRSAGYEIDANDEKFHQEMLTLANKAKCMIFISGYENEIYESILTDKLGWGSKEIEATTKGNKGESLARKEIVWMNKYYLKALESGKVPIKLTDRELKEKKLNPERL